jgi:hypothetical protein
MTEEQRNAAVSEMLPEVFGLVRRMGEDLTPNASLGTILAINTDVAVRFLATVLSVSGGVDEALAEVTRRVAKINEAKAARVMN